MEEEASQQQGSGLGYDPSTVFVLGAWLPPLSWSVHIVFTLIKHSPNILWFRGQDRFLDRLWATANLAQRGQKAFKQTVDGALNRRESAERNPVLAPVAVEHAKERKSGSHWTLCWRRQSRANPSLKPNSLLAGKIQGILFVWASECGYWFAIAW